MEKGYFLWGKSFNLDEPDSWDYYYHDFLKKKYILSRRQIAGGTAMIWTAIGIIGKTDIIVLPSKLNAKMYLDLLQRHLLLKAPIIASRNSIFE